MKNRKIIIIIALILCFFLLPACGQSKTNNESSAITESETEKNPSSKEPAGTSNKHTVTFKDYDGTILKVDTVDEGKSIEPPINASKAGYKIVKWNKPLDNIKEDIVVTPVYEKISGPTIFVENVTAKPGDTVKIPVKLQNNSGINGATIKVSFDSNLVLKKVKNGKALKELNFTKPGELSRPCSFLWDGMDENITEDGEMLLLIFKISDNVKSGEKLGISISYTDGAIYDKDLQNVDFDVVGGSITIE